VEVEIAGLGRMSARVDDVGEETITVALTVGLDHPLEAYASGDAVVEFGTARGLYRLNATVDGDCDGGSGGVLRLTVRGDAEVLQRREHVRAGAVRAVTLSTDDGDVDTVTIDVSAGGMLLADAPGLEAGDRANFALDLGSGRPPVAGVAHVVRVTDQGFRAVQIERVEARAQELLVHYVFERQREALRRGLAG
jgi:hypothetical protein